MHVKALVLQYLLSHERNEGLILYQKNFPPGRLQWHAPFSLLPPDASAATARSLSPRKRDPLLNTTSHEPGSSYSLGPTETSSSLK